MSTNKNATIRYHSLDQCFSNKGRLYCIDDLLLSCNNALYEYEGVTDGVKKRQLFEDIKFMESDQGWSIQLERVKEGRRVYYRYLDMTFSIKKQSINAIEAKQLQETLSILNRFKGMPQFEWIEEILIRLESIFKLKGDSPVIVEYDYNPYLKGLNYFTEIFRAIYNKKVLVVDYKGFNKDSVCFEIHPYFLKQYNNRWFLFGLHPELNLISNVAIDRIFSLTLSESPYLENKTINFDTYFDDIVGVTTPVNSQPERVLFQVDNSLIGYLESKLIHSSQKTMVIDDQVCIELFLIINYEFETLLFGLMDRISILSPLTLKEKLVARAKQAVEKNF